MECHGIAATPRKNKIEQRRRWATARAVDSITVCWVGGASIRRWETGECGSYVRWRLDAFGNLG